MRSAMLSVLIACALVVVPFIPLAGASDFGPGTVAMASLASVASDGHMATGGFDLRAFLAWLKQLLNKYLGAGGNGGGGGGGGGGYNGTSPKGSLPIPGTLLLFGGGFASLMIWQARRARS